MPTQFAIAGVNAKRRGAETGMVSAENGSIQPDLLAFSISLFPRKTWAFLTDLLGLSDSAARKRVAGDTEFSADDMAKMLRTERGFEVLAAVMAGSGVRWWKICAPLMEVADIQSAQIAARRRLTRVMKGAVDADTNLAAAIARADALAFSDEDFMRPHGDALRSMARVPDRALAAAKGRRR